MGETAPPESSSLCLSCGLCCNGVLFHNARAEADEVPTMRALGLEVEQAGERLQFRLPCPHHREGGCAIYRERFTKCRTFRCALLRKLDAGETNLTEALASVAKAKEMLRRLAGVDARAARVDYRAERRRAEPPRNAGGGGAGRLWLDMIAFDMFLDRTFRNKPAIKAIEDQGAAAG